MNSALRAFSMVLLVFLLPACSRVTTNPEPLNLDFESGTEGWHMGSSGYRYELSNEAQSGKRCVGISYSELGDSFGNVGQKVSPEAYLNKTIRLTAAVRVVYGQAQLWLRVDGPGNSRLFFDNMNDRPIITGPWAHYSIEAKVDPEAKMINFGGFVLGEGEAYFDDFRLEIVDEEPVTP